MVPVVPVAAGIVFGAPASREEVGSPVTPTFVVCLPIGSLRPPEDERPVHEYGQNECAIAPGRKNRLFVGSASGGRAVASAHAPIETARFNDFDPQVCGVLRI